MSLFIRVNCNFYAHRKTRRLQVLMGNDALWLPPRLWAYAAEFHPDGVLADESAEELALAVGYQGDATSMLQALLQAGFLDEKPLRIHDWQDHNGYHERFAARAKLAAQARWQKERTKEKGDEIEKRERGEELSIATSMLVASDSYSPRSTRARAQSNGEGNGAMSSDPSTPTWAAVKQYADMQCIPESSAKRYFDNREGKCLWFNQHGKLINWRHDLKAWAEEDRQRQHQRTPPARNGGAPTVSPTASERELAAMARQIERGQL